MSAGHFAFAFVAGPVLLIGGAYLFRHPGVAIGIGIALALAVVVPMVGWVAVNWRRARANNALWRVEYRRQVDRSAQAAMARTKRGLAAGSPTEIS